MRTFSNKLSSHKNNLPRTLLLSCALMVLADSAYGGTTTLSDGTHVADITGNEDVVKTGTGITLLTGTNDYSGSTTISDGILELVDADAISTVTSGFSIDDATLKVDVDFSTNEPFSFTGAGIIDVTGNDLTLSGNINDGTNDVILKGDSVTLSGSNIWTSTNTLKVATGTLTLTNAASIEDASILVNDGTTIVLTGGVTYAPTSLGIAP